MSINIPVLLIGRAFAAERDDSRHDTQRASLLPALLPNPFVGMMMAAILAKQGERDPAPAKPAGVAGAGGATGAAAARAVPALARPAPTAAGGPAAPGGTPGTGAVPSAADLAGAARLMAHIIPHDFFPSFLGLSWRQALKFAELAGVTPHSRDDSHDLVVISQRPGPGEDWPHSTRDVHLTFGDRQEIGL